MRAALLVLLLGGARLGADPGSPPDESGHDHPLATGPASSLAFTPQTCPIMPWEPVDPTVFVEEGGVRTYLCCNKCRKRWLQGERPDPGTDIEAAFAAIRDRPSPAFCPTPVAAAAPGTAPAGRLARLHPVAVHFPIALMLMAALGELLALVRKSPLFTEGARFALLGAGASAIPAALLGLVAGGLPTPGEDAVLALHRTLGVAAGLAIPAVATLHEYARRSASVPLQALARLLVLAAAGLVAAAGHQGGILVYGP